MSVTLSISIPAATEARLRKIASAAGKDLPGYVSQLLEQTAGKDSLEEFLLPLRKQFADSGTTDEQLVDEISSAQDAYRADQRKMTA